MGPEQTSAGKRWTPRELRELSPQEREAILAAQAVLAEEEYRTNPQLTDFETFGEDDLHGECTIPPTG